MAQKMSSLMIEKGFTLIELMIVIAILGVLAAIAIPQFSAYRLRSFNSAALSDLWNYKLAEEGFFNEQRVFGYSTNGGNVGGLALVTGPSDSSTMVSNGTNGLNFGLSNRVLLYGVVDGTGAAYNVTTKHMSGDRLFGADSDVSSIFWLDSTPGTPLVVADTPAAGTPGSEFGTWNNL